MKILFVCTGNICRSPTAEGVFRHMIKEAGLENKIQTDGCGIQGWHIGKAPDQRTVDAARQRGFDLSPLRARQLVQSDFQKFDLILAMDQGHYQSLQNSAPIEAKSRIRMFLEPVNSNFGTCDVPDPYYGGPDGFETVLDMIESASHAWLKSLQDNVEG